MKLSLIGMSGSGKSHWSDKLEKKGFKQFCVDDLIEERLGEELKQLGYSGINDVSKWMGQPYDTQYARTSSQYLKFEKEIMQEIIEFLKNSNTDNIVINTTGSVIYTGKTILKQLGKHTKIIYLETPQSVQQEMYELYIKDPKPVIWGKSFSKKIDETNKAALAGRYPELLAFRTKQYKKYAHKTLDYHKLREKNFTVSKFLLLLGEGV